MTEFFPYNSLFFRNICYEKIHFSSILTFFAFATSLFPFLFEKVLIIFKY